MRYPVPLRAGGVIGVCAPSSGVREGRCAKLDAAHQNVRALGYDTVETASVRCNAKCVSADAATRAAEFAGLYLDPGVDAVIPTHGGASVVQTQKL